MAADNHFNDTITILCRLLSLTAGYDTLADTVSLSAQWFNDNQRQPNQPETEVRSTVYNGFFATQI